MFRHDDDDDGDDDDDEEEEEEEDDNDAFPNCVIRGGFCSEQQPN